MEPMTLGSAPSSPASPGLNPNFLPGYLMGESQPSTPNPTSISPGRNRTPASAKVNINLNEPRSLRQKLFNQSLSESAGPQSPYASMSEKAGPPKTGLFDTINHLKNPISPVINSTAVNTTNFSDSVGFNESISRIHPEDSLNYTRNTNLSETLNKSTANRLEKIDTHWITVFGFPPSALNIVLSQFSNSGVIVDKKIPPQGNWVHLKFNNYSEVARALSLNAKCINNCIMIGAQLYYDKENKENDTSIYTSPMRARSLRHSFVSPQNPNTVVSPQSVPQKSTGLVTKAMEYVFGW